MAIPDFQTLMLPVLRFAADGEVTIQDAVELMAQKFGLSDEERSELLPSGKQTTFANRTHWAKFYLGKAGLIQLTRRSHFVASERGRSVLSNPPERIDIAFLRQFPDFDLTKSQVGGQKAIETSATADDLTPDETMRQARDLLETELGRELLSRIQAAPPAFFERVVVQLLISMGYGGSLARAGRALGRSGDGGVDGVIDEDTLGLDRIYVQAKRYAAGNAVGPGEIRDFFGALDQFKAGKGLFVTTSSFTPSAIKTVEGLSKRIVLIDGTLLTRLMIDHGVGCRVEDTLYVKKLDDEFFEF
ncbi:restriction endonuclease [Brevundimonas sp.]|uniref:restriction endonuclease n=1 Tax=Brevundimonas sp. TaxID=1871086 RepID=UPI002FDAB814